MFKRTIADLGTEWELTNEFVQYKAQHKYSVLMAKMIDYYATIMQDEILLPFDTPEARAEEDVRKVFNKGKDEFDRLYELAWQEMAEKMD